MFDTIQQTFVVKQSISCAELDEFKYVELIYYKVGQALLKTGARITK